MAAPPVDLGRDRVGRLAQTVGSQVERWMSDAEQARLAAMTATTRRQQFVAGRWLARWLLARRWGGQPEDWPLTAPDWGPPGLMNPPQGASIHLSLSHSGDHVACAVGEVPLGLDLECLRRDREVMAMARAICSGGEQSLLQLQQGAGLQRLFHELWTVKEAWIKSRSESLTPGRMSQIALEPLPATCTGPARVWTAENLVLALVAPPGTPVSWHGEPLDPGRSWCVRDSALQGGA